MECDYLQFKYSDLEKKEGESSGLNIQMQLIYLKLERLFLWQATKFFAGLGHPWKRKKKLRFL